MVEEKMGIEKERILELQKRYEEGKIIGGLVKYYGKNNKAPIW